MNWNDPLPHSDPAPLWFQIAERLRGAIKHGKFRPGDALPSEAQLNQTFGVSRATSRTSLERLRQDGLIKRQSGRGSIVITPRIDQPVTQVLGFADDMKRLGLRPSYETRFAGRAKAPAEVAEALRIRTGSSVFRSRRLLKADGSPIGFTDSWLSPALLGSAKLPTVADLDRRSLYEWLETACRIRITSAHEFIEAAIVQDAIARELGISPNAAVLIARRLSRDAAGQPIEYAVLYFRPDRYRFHLEVNR